MQHESGTTLAESVLKSKQSASILSLPCIPFVKWVSGLRWRWDVTGDCLFALDTAYFRRSLGAFSCQSLRVLHIIIINWRNNKIRFIIRDKAFGYYLGILKGATCMLMNLNSLNGEKKRTFNCGILSASYQAYQLGIRLSSAHHTFTYNSWGLISPNGWGISHHAGADWSYLIYCPVCRLGH